MSNPFIVYQSQTGFTQQYAQWLSESLHGSCQSLKETSAQELDAAEELIYGGWIMANRIQGLDKILKIRKSRLVVFGVGASLPSEEQEKLVREASNLPTSIPLFYLQGGINYEKLGFIQRTALHTMQKSLARKKNPTEMERLMAQALASSFDASDKQSLSPLIACLRREG